MSLRPITEPLLDAEARLEGFDNLMPFKVQNILLVSSLYDSFILREDGRLNELLIDESLELNLQQIPGITHVSSCAEALELARSQPRFNLIVTNLAVGEMTAAQLASDVKRAGLDVPVVVLAYDYREVKNFISRNPVTDIERIFLWQGNARILIAIVKYIEDKRNVLHDTRAMGVPVLLVVEDNIRYYSSFLPVIYTELIKQSRRVIQEGINVAHKLVRMQARPKILLSSNFEDAAQLVQEYRDYLIGLVSDVEFPWEGKLSPETGFELARLMKAMVPDVPVVLQTSRTEFRPRALAAGYSFLRKRSPTLLKDLRRILTEQFGFGDFVFRLPDMTEVGRAKDLNQLEEQLQTVPPESLTYHAQSNHFSHWLMARTEFALAAKLRPRKVSDFTGPEHLRRDLIESIIDYRREQSELLIGDFNADTFKPSETGFLRIGAGSLGGKARGLAFVRHLLRKNRITRRFPGIRIAVPPALVLATDAFDQFMVENNLLDFALQCENDAEILEKFLAASLSTPLQQNLKVFLAEVTYPLAVRSSSLLEDSQYQPFTGVYETFMLGNQSADPDMRLAELVDAIKRVYASTFSRHAKAYVRATPYRLEEEKMAVIVQQLVGTVHGQRFYPDFSGVVRSHNFYPVPPMMFADGIAAVALGLGRAVVDGGKCLTFCPRYPQNLLQFSSVDDMLANSQTEFWALELDGASQGRPGHLHELRFGLEAAEADGTLPAVASTYSVDNQAVYDGVSRAGARIVSFAPVLKHGMFPLAAILEMLVKAGEDALGIPVEIEFAVRLPQRSGESADFGFLQIRPLTLSRDHQDLSLDHVEPSQLLCQSSKVLGNGRIENLNDVVVVDSQRFERSRSQEVAKAVAHFNSLLSAENRPYLLIGVGRWGSNDPWLGIPVEWDEISGARVIVEAGFHDFRVTPSQGSHFFQNLTAFQIGYFTVNPDAGEGSVDWEWLNDQPSVDEDGCVRHLHFDTPMRVVMNSRQSQGIIFKPQALS
ncbi:MAG TPA: PEP/pyruvate-binding domain-containing protein [Verrucomicrobiae bacterium]|jgi:CheY-like chemotaxis protein|nr:PEP/pyruvate-binding domain-containing protein [Verrucomicrobiae bacterium]